MLEIPLSGGAVNAHQTFSCLLGENELDFRLDYMAYIDVPAWSMTISKDNEILVAGLLLKAGCDMLKPYNLGIGSLELIGDDPTLDNLGVNNKLVWTENVQV